MNIKQLNETLKKLLESNISEFFDEVKAKFSSDNLEYIWQDNDIESGYIEFEIKTDVEFYKEGELEDLTVDTDLYKIHVYVDNTYKLVLSLTIYDIDNLPDVETLPINNVLEKALEIEFYCIDIKEIVDEEENFELIDSLPFYSFEDAEKKYKELTKTLPKNQFIELSDSSEDIIKSNFSEVCNKLNNL